MCMNISKEDLMRINKGFGGNLRSDSSLDFALDKQNDKKLLAEGYTVNVFVNKKTMKSVPIPKNLRNKLEEK